jgi:transaldolase / glucose-6-phosphate isomerase
VSNPLAELGHVGQSVWLDFIRRSLLTTGALARLVREDHVSGVTSNPTIFQKALSAGSDYDGQLQRVLARQPDLAAPALFDAVALVDIRAAADVLRPVFDRSEGTDGYVSHEVAASLANDAAGTIAEGRRLWAALERPNVMIKVPATPAGVEAIEQLTADGINVNATLMFSLTHYEQVAQAYVRGLERCANPARVASVASFFVSRVDTVVDKALDGIGTPEALALRGRTAIANCKLVYQRFQQIFNGASFGSLRARGCRPQRPLWASTSTKNPAYRDVVYVEELIGPDTVNTMPPETVDGFRHHGQVRVTIDEGVDAARATIAQLKTFGIDLEAVTAKLQVDGVASFAKSYVDLLAALDGKRARLAQETVDVQELDLGAYHSAVAQRLDTWAAAETSRRIWEKDHTVWSPELVPELTNRLGWLPLATTMRAEVAAMTAFADELRAEGIEHIVLLGMGGSSLAPEVFQATFGRRAGFPALTVLDSTHPDAVRAVEARIDLAHSLFVVSSKSGGTSETTSFFRYFWHRYAEGAAGRHFIAITDPGTSLEKLARDRGFRRVFNAPPDVGGRFSALTPFGLVPAALIGVDVETLLARTERLAAACGPTMEREANPGLALGAALGELASKGRDKVTFLVAPPFESLPVWLEQLIAESTGKYDKGIVPVADEAVRPAPEYANDRVFVAIAPASFDDAALSKTCADLAALGHPVIRITPGAAIDLGQEFYRFEFATAAAGAALGIQPFDQPDVQLAKDLARRAMEQVGKAGQETASPILTDASAWKSAAAAWIASAKPGDYVGLHAYLATTPETTALLEQIREAIGRRTTLATTLGYGPRFLHSTGQLHKGGPNTGVFLQITDEAAEDLTVPEAGFTFGQLIRAQAAGDAMALEQRGRRLLKIGVGKSPIDGLKAFLATL